MKMPKKNFSKNDLLNLLKKQNIEVFKLLEDRGVGSVDPEIQKRLEFESVETDLLIKMIFHLEGKIPFEEII